MKQSTELHHQQAACTWVDVAKMTLCLLPHVYVSPLEAQICLCGRDFMGVSHRVGLQHPMNRSAVPTFLRQTHIYVHDEKWQDTQNYKTQKTPNTTNTSFTMLYLYHISLFENGINPGAVAQ